MFALLVENLAVVVLHFACLHLASLFLPFLLSLMILANSSLTLALLFLTALQKARFLLRIALQTSLNCLNNQVPNLPNPLHLRVDTKSVNDPRECIQS